MKLLDSMSALQSRICFSCLIFLFCIAAYLSGCSSSSENSEERKVETHETVSEENAEPGLDLLRIASQEQNNRMYSRSCDTAYMYWLDSALLVTHGLTKCNVYLLNVLALSGYMTPSVNALAKDIYDTLMFRSELPVIAVNDISKARTGDVIAWKSHVILFESIIRAGEEEFVLGYWSGTESQDNGASIINNVCHGKYRLTGDFVVRRPVKKGK